MLKPASKDRVFHLPTSCDIVVKTNKKQANKRTKPTGLKVDIAVRLNAWELKTSYVLTYLWGRGLLKLSAEHLFGFKVSSTTQGHTRMRDRGGWVVREGGWRGVTVTTTKATSCVTSSRMFFATCCCCCCCPLTENYMCHSLQSPPATPS